VICTKIGCVILFNIQNMLSLKLSNGIFHVIIFLWLFGTTKFMDPKFLLSFPGWKNFYSVYSHKQQKKSTQLIWLELERK